MITVKIHSDGEMIDTDLPLEHISDVIEADRGLVWVDAQKPSADEVACITEEFSLHPLAIEDAMVRHERPKVEQFDEFLLIIFYAFEFDETRNVMAWHQIAIFGGHNYVLTLHNSDVPVLDEISARWMTSYKSLPQHAPGLLIYSILDALVDGYLPIVDHVSDRIDDLEDAIFTNFDTAAMQEIFRLKRDLLTMRKILTPERDVLNTLMRRDTPVYNEETARYFQDIYDHLLRVLDSVDTFRDLLSSALDSYLSVLSNRMNQVMKTLTASSIILMALSLIAGIYGMNFLHMPELQWHYGYF
ncbi:MAG TPA: magnesium/cobalt transporter CorA, partial [Thermomicrobiales bacterium]|nr:magnesium/cobalt transporter CorA [Thermomicrobiales bacterium]